MAWLPEAPAFLRPGATVYRGNTKTSERVEGGLSGSTCASGRVAGQPVIYVGEPLMLGSDEAAWVPVDAPKIKLLGNEVVCSVHNSTATSLEIAPGIWPTGEVEGTVLVANVTEHEIPLEFGGVVGELVGDPVATSICNCCGSLETYLEEGAEREFDR